MVNKKSSIGHISDFEIKHLRVFRTVVDCGGFSAAETVLNISRPTISNHMASLEARLDMTLCKRGRAGFSLTEEGQVIYKEAVKMLDSIEGFRNAANNIRSAPSGSLKIVLSDLISLDSRSRFPEIVERFRQWAPDIYLKVSMGEMSDIERGVLNDEIDIGFIPYHRELEGLHYLHLYSDTHYLYCGRSHPLFDIPEDQLSDEEINNTPLVHAGLQPHDEVFENISEMNLAAASYFYESRIALIMSGGYIGFLPAITAMPYVERGELKRIAADTKHFNLGVAVVIKKAKIPNRAREYFHSAIEKVFNDKPDTAPS